MADKAFRFGPLALTTTLTTNLLNPAAASGGVNAGASGQFITLSHIRISNKTASAATFSLWVGGTGANVAGTELGAIGQTVPANSYVDLWFGMKGLRLDTTDFLVGGASANTALTIQGEGTVGVAG